VSRTDLRALLAIAATALALRAGTAVLTEYKPIFPSYYYNDSVFVDKYARETVNAWAIGQSRNLAYSPSQRVHILLTALIYRVCGPRPIAAKIVNALAATAGIVAFGLLAGRLFAPRAALAAAGLMALWPSHVFYTSQNFREGLVCGILMGVFLLLTPADRTAPRAEIGAGIVLLAAMGFLRSYVMLTAAAALSTGALALLRRQDYQRTAALILVACLAALALYNTAMHGLLFGPLKANTESPVSEHVLIPRIANAQNSEIYRPLSPRGITEFRFLRQHSDRMYAQARGHEIGTQIYPAERMNTWLDVILFIPKSSFHILFMPLPGLYPIDGKPGRMLAAAENLLLLALVVLGLAAAVRGGWQPRRLGLLLFCAAMTVGYSLLEFDLGSASRHKLMYLPMLFPFAAEEALRLAGSRIKL
jgi:hypothetical protein